MPLNNENLQMSENNVVNYQTLTSMLHPFEEILSYCEVKYLSPFETPFGLAAVTRKRMLFASSTWVSAGAPTAQFPLSRVKDLTWLSKTDSGTGYESFTFTGRGLAFRLVCSEEGLQYAIGKDFKNVFMTAVKQVREKPSFIKQRFQKIKIWQLAVVTTLVLGIFAFNSLQTRLAADKAAAIASDFCEDVKQLKTVEMINDRESLANAALNALDNYEKKGSSEYASLDSCYEQQIRLYVPREVTAQSDAQLAAEGNSCRQQWRSARSETLSGTGRDVQLRATVYACNSFDDWLLEAIEIGEYNDYLLASICALESSAPAALCR